jgi:hypothetical protein
MLGAKMPHPTKEYREEAQRLAEEWMTPFRERQQSDDLQAIGFAKLAIQSLLLLHGGALVAIPTLITLLPTEAGKQSVWKFIFLFTLGLIFAVGGAIAAFFSLSKRGDYYTEMAGERYHSAWAHIASVRLAVNPDDPGMAMLVQNSNEEAKRITEDAKPLEKAFQWWRTMGVALILLSVFCLVAAAAVAVRS